jgi:transposase
MSDASDPTLPGVPSATPAVIGDEVPARYETANRTQIELMPTDLEALLPPGHAARLVWRFVEGLQLSAFYATIKAREGRAGRPPIDPQILIALWLYATIDGVGSARELDRLCDRHDAYRWIRGGVSVNYHTLSEFRVAHHTALDDLLTQSIATLRYRGIVTLARVAQDGTRVRASARAAADRLARVEEALATLPAVADAKARTAGKRKKGARPAEARVSTTDPEARVMKLADGGFRPAYNIQFATDGDSGAVVGVAATNVGSDFAEFVPMVEQVQARTGQYPTAMLVDRGVSTNAGITHVAGLGVTVYSPVPKTRGVRDPTARCPHDSAAVAAWRTRMATAPAQAVYRQRGAIAERINADARTHRTLSQVSVRGLAKVHTWAVWVALAIMSCARWRSCPT